MKSQNLFSEKNKEISLSSAELSQRGVKVNDFLAYIRTAKTPFRLRLRARSYPVV